MPKQTPSPDASTTAGDFSAIGGVYPTFDFADKPRVLKITARHVAAIEAMFGSHEKFIEEAQEKPALMCFKVLGGLWGAGTAEDLTVNLVDAAMDGVDIFALRDALLHAWNVSVRPVRQDTGKAGATTPSL